MTVQPLYSICCAPLSTKMLFSMWLSRPLCRWMPGPRSTRNDVADNIDAPRVVIQINAPGKVGREPAIFLATIAENVVKEVMPDDGTARRDPVAAARIDGAGILGLQADVTNVVVFDRQVVAGEHDAHPRPVVDQVVRGAIADAIQADAGPLSIEHADMMNIVIVRVVLGAVK